MAKGKLKLVSMRLPKELISAIDIYAEQRKYLTRTQVISNILVNVWECTDALTLHKLIDTWDAYSAGYTVHFTTNK